MRRPLLAVLAKGVKENQPDRAGAKQREGSKARKIQGRGGVGMRERGQREQAEALRVACGIMPKWQRNTARVT